MWGVITVVSHCASIVLLLGYKLCCPYIKFNSSIHLEFKTNFNTTLMPILNNGMLQKFFFVRRLMIRGRSSDYGGSVLAQSVVLAYLWQLILIASTAGNVASRTCLVVTTNRIVCF